MCSITPNNYLLPYRSRIAGGQDCVLFENVFQYLNLQEATTGILVSKYWRKAITKTPILQNVIFKYMYLFGTVKNVKNVDYFLVGEIHTSRICKRLLAGLISCYSYNFPLIILTEWPHSLHVPPEPYLKSLNLPSSLSPNIRVYGWDEPSHCEEVGNFLEIQIELENQRMSLKNMIKSLEESLAKAKDPGEAAHFEKGILTLRTHLEIIEKQIKKGLIDPEQVKRTFPQRTQSMIRVLDTVHKQILGTGFPGKIIVQSGLAHLITLPIHHNIKEYCLKEFHTYLQNLRACVVFSKGIDVLRH